MPILTDRGRRGGGVAINPQVPDPPVLIGTPGNAVVHLSWSIPDDNGSGITSFNVYRAGVLIASQGGTIYDDTGRTNGTAYSYRVTAVNAVGESIVSNLVTVTPVANPPAAPVMSGTAGNGSNAVSWTVPANGGSAITNYKVYRNGSLLTTVGAVTSLTDSTVTNGVTYTYNVSAVNSAGEGPQSNTISLTPSGSGLTIPPDSNAVVAASKVGVWAGNGHQYCPIGSYPTAIPQYNFRAFKSVTPYLAGYGVNKTFKGTTAAADSPSGNFSLQRAFEGLPSPENANATGNGLGQGLQLGYIDQAILGFYMTVPTGRRADGTLTDPRTLDGLFGDMSVAATRADVCSKIAGLVAFMQLLGGGVTGKTGISMDWETGNWSGTPGLTAAQHWALMELFGFEVGQAIWGTWPGCEVWIYNFQCDGAWHQYVNSGGPNGPTNDTVPRFAFMAGLLRAHTAATAVGRVRWLDHFWYRAGAGMSGVSLVTSLRYNVQTVLAKFSTDMPQSTWDRASDYFDVCCFHWAGTDATTFYTNTQESEPAYSNGELTYREWSMGGWRYEYNGPGTAIDSLWFRDANAGIYNGHNPYTFPTGRQAILTGSAASPSGSFATDIPTIKSSTGVADTVTQTRAGQTGSNVLVSLYAFHSRAIRNVSWKVYNASNVLQAQGKFKMVHDLNGGTVTTGIANSRVAISQAVPAVAGSKILITAMGAMSVPPSGPQHSILVTAA